MRKYILFLLPLLAACNSGEEITSTQIAEPVAHIVEYTPAPGQFINEPKSGYAQVTTPEAACAYAQRRMASSDYVSLGGWGGYIVARFATPVPNTGGYDLYVKGNAMTTSSEPGIVWVAQANAKGEPEQWYALRGSEYDNSTADYQITYTRPTQADAEVSWQDNKGMSGTIKRIGDHTQPHYYPAWITDDQLTFEGVLLPSNLIDGQVDDNGLVQAWIAQPFQWGYVDNYSPVDASGVTNRFRISNAMTADGHFANLPQIDFIKVQTGVNDGAPRIGELSTEVCGMGCYRTVISK